MTRVVAQTVQYNCSISHSALLALFSVEWFLFGEQEIKECKPDGISTLYVRQLRRELPIFPIPGLREHSRHRHKLDSHDRPVCSLYSRVPLIPRSCAHAGCLLSFSSVQVRESAYGKVYEVVVTVRMNARRWTRLLTRCPRCSVCSRAV